MYQGIVAGWIPRSRLWDEFQYARCFLGNSLGIEIYERKGKETGLGGRKGQQSRYHKALAVSMESFGFKITYQNCPALGQIDCNDPVSVRHWL